MDKALQKPWYKKWFVKWPLILVLVFLVLDYVVVPVGVGMYVNMAPKATSCCKTPKDAGMDFQWVDLKNTDGSKLTGWFIPAETTKTIVLLHGAMSTKSTMLDHAAFLHTAGYNTFLLDAHGHGDSEGRTMEYGWNAPNDVTTVINWLEKQPALDSSKIALLGLSMGAEGALSAAAVDTRVQAVVAEGGSAHVMDDEVLMPNAPATSYPFHWLMYATMKLMSDDPIPVSIPKAMELIQPRPVLLISGESSKEQYMNSIYAELGGTTTTHWVLGDTPHTQGLFKHAEEYKKRVLLFYDTSM